MPPRSAAKAATKATKPKPPARSALDTWLDAHVADVERLDNGKIRFTLTGVDVPCQLPLLEAYYSGRSLRRAREAKSMAAIDVASMPHIIEHKHSKGRLYCTLTKKTLNRHADEIRAHLSGKHYQHELKKLQERESRRAELEAARQAKRERLEAARKNGANSLSVDDDGVFDRLPDAIVDEEGEGEDEENEDAASADDDDEEDVIVRAVDDDNGMPIVRKRETTRKRQRDVDEDDTETVDEQAVDDEGFEEVGADDSDEPEDEDEGDIVEQPRTKRGKANGHITNGRANRTGATPQQHGRQQTAQQSRGRTATNGRGRGAGRRR